MFLSNSPTLRHFGSMYAAGATSGTQRSVEYSPNVAGVSATNLFAQGIGFIAPIRVLDVTSPAGSPSGSNLFFPTSSQQPSPKSPLLHLDKLSDVKGSRGRTHEGICSICNDRATGRHYGASSCDGCKGFFRRTVRRSQEYTCRFTKDCNIDKAKRNACRYCRYTKCVRVGMKIDAVQSERDKIKPRRRIKSNSPHSDATQPSDESPSLMPTLMRAEEICSQVRRTVIHSSDPTEPEGISRHQRLATVNDITDAMRQYLLLLVEWAKAIPVFCKLELDDQIALLRAYSAQHLLMSLARRSMPYKDMLVISNESCIHKQHISEQPRSKVLRTPTDVLLVNSHVFARILDELIDPMKLLELDDAEFVYLKSIVFFNPNAHGLKQKEAINDIRQSVLLDLDKYISQKTPTDKNRVGNILLLSSPLQGVAQLMVESVQVASQYGLFNIDNLLQEMLLNANDAAELLSKFTKPSQKVPVLTPTAVMNERFGTDGYIGVHMSKQGAIISPKLEQPINFSIDKLSSGIFKPEYGPSSYQHMDH